MSGHAEALTLFNRKDYPPKLIVSRTPQTFKAECAEALQQQEQDRVQRDPELMRQLGQTTLTDIINQPEL